MRLHPDGRPYGMTKRDYRRTQRGLPVGCPLARQMAANQFNADVKTHGLTEALRMHGIEEDAA